MTQSESVVVVAALVARIANIPAPAADDDMYSAGLASTDALELLVELEDTFGITIPDDRFIEARTVGQLAGVVNDLKGNAA